MANPKHLEILRQGVYIWNQWRSKNLEFKSDLEGEGFVANFIKADLSETNFIKADLSEADLRGVELSEANLQGANLQGANLTNANLVKANLSKADLSEAILSRANFYRAILTSSSLVKADCRNTIFTKANLESSNLQKAEMVATIALITSFEGANLTGACIQDWSINSETNLQNIKCDYIYLKSRWEKNIRKVFFEERRPHDSEEIFAPGDFERLVRKAQETVDLIFRNGIDWQAFLNSYEQLKIEAGGDFLPIQAIENKGDGSFIVRIQAAPELNKGKIQKSFETKYKRALKLREQQYRERLNAKDREIEVYREQNTNLWEMVKLKASQPFNIIQQQGDSIMSGDKYTQSGNFGIGHMSGGTINEGAKVAGVINEAEQKNLAEAAAEIQQLLDQLSQTYPPEEAEQKVAEDLANKAKQDPAVKENLKSWSLSLAGKGVETGVVETVKESVKRVIPLAISLLI